MVSCSKQKVKETKINKTNLDSVLTELMIQVLRKTNNILKDKKKKVKGVMAANTFTHETYPRGKRPGIFKTKQNKNISPYGNQMTGSLWFGRVYCCNKLPQT